MRIDNLPRADPQKAPGNEVLQAVLICAPSTSSPPDELPSRTRSSPAFRAGVQYRFGLFRFPVQISENAGCWVQEGGPAANAAGFTHAHRSSSTGNGRTEPG